MASRSRTIELGASACSIVFVIEANSLKNMLMASVIVNATSIKKKNGPGSRRRFAITTNKILSVMRNDLLRGYSQYSVELTTKELVIL